MEVRQQAHSWCAILIFAVKTAPPIVMLSEAKHLVIASVSEAFKRLERSLGILCLLIVALVTLARNDKK